MILDHLTLPVADYETSKQFCRRVLAPLGIGIVVEFVRVAGFGRDGKADFWLAGGESRPPLHIAFAARSRAEVDAFHAERSPRARATTDRPGCGRSTIPTTAGLS